MRKYILPYKVGSKSVKALKEMLRIKSLKLEGSKVRGTKDTVVVNWGSRKDHPILHSEATILNPPEAIQSASNKLTAFRRMQEAGVTVPPFTDNKRDAADWKLTVARAVLNGHSGEGISLHKRGEELPDVPLYVKYIPKEHEYRVHVWKDEVIDIRRKALRNDYEGEADWKVRNYDNGFIFAKEIGHQPHHSVVDQSIAAIAALGLDFGAVDIVFNTEQQVSYVLEVNTAPGLQGSTVNNYAQKIVEMEG